MEKARRAAAASGGSVRETADRDEALRGRAGAVRQGMGRHRHATAMPTADARLRAPLTDWCVRDELVRRAARDCRLMHCLPVRRNIAVADEVLDGPRSVVQREAYNRLPVQMAVLHRMLKRH